MEPAELMAVRDRIRSALGAAARETTDARRGFRLLQWPCPWDPDKPFELSLEHEVRLKPAAMGSECWLAAALEFCNGRSAAVLLPGCAPAEELAVRAEPRPAGTQSVDLYHDDAGGGAGGLVRRGFTFRERTSASAFMTWGSAGGALRPINCELPSWRAGDHGLSARLEFNWRERDMAVAPAPRTVHHPLTMLAEIAGFDPEQLAPLLRHETVRRKFELVRPDGAAAFVVNLDFITAQLVGDSAAVSYVDVDLSALQPATESLLAELDEIAAALIARYDLVPNAETKAARSLRMTRGEEVPPVHPRRRSGPGAPARPDLRIGIVGPGKAADRHLAPAIARVPGVRLWSVAGRDRTRAAEFAARHSAASQEPVKDSLDALLADPELDAVVIASPDVLHADHALRAVRAGLHVFCEKPLVTRMEDGIDLWSEVWKAGVALAVGYQLRGHPAHRRAAEAVRAGRIGRLRHATARWTYRTPDPHNWRSRPDGSRWWAAAAFGTHLLDLLRWLLVPTCGEVLRIQHFSSRGTWRSPNDETTLSALEFASGATAELTASVSFASSSRLELIGEGGMILCEDTLAQQTQGTLWVGGAQELFPAEDMYVREMEDFVAAVREGRQPEVEVVEGVRNIQLLSAGEAP